VFRFNRQFWTTVTFDSVLKTAAGAEAPTYAELFKGTWSRPGGWADEPGGILFNNRIGMLFWTKIFIPYLFRLPSTFSQYANY
jgi:hypothetical protein